MTACAKSSPNKTGPRSPATGTLDHTQHDFRMLVEAVSDYAVYMLTPEGVVSSWNRGAERNKGYTSAEAIGLHVSGVLYTGRPRERRTREGARGRARGQVRSFTDGESERTEAVSGLMW